jgi:hypothetical protein
MAGQYHGSGDALEGAVESCDVVSKRSQRGRAAATTGEPSPERAPITFAQLEPSAHAPWTRATLASLRGIWIGPSGWLKHNRIKSFNMVT